MRGNTGGRLRLAPAMEAGLTENLWKSDDLFDAALTP
jgi:hypothetical protein